MKLRPLSVIFAALALFSCTRERSTEEVYLEYHRQKFVSVIEAGGLDGVDINSIRESFSPEAQSVPMEIDLAGAVQFRGVSRPADLLEHTASLDPQMDAAQFESILEEMTACLGLTIYYDSDYSRPRAALILQKASLRDNYGVFLSYEPAFRFSEGIAVTIEEFFNSSVFYPYRDKLAIFRELWGNI